MCRLAPQSRDALWRRGAGLHRLSSLADGRDPRLPCRRGEGLGIRVSVMRQRKGKADLTRRLPVCPLSAVKRTKSKQGTKSAFDPKRTLTSLKSRTAAVQIYRPHPTSRRELNDSPHRRAPCRGTPNTTSLSRTRSPAADRG